jgi:hypothetical protein
LGRGQHVGLLIGKVLPGLTAALRGLEFGERSHINTSPAAGFTSC